MYLFHYSHLPQAFYSFLHHLPDNSGISTSLSVGHHSLFQALRAIPVLKWGPWEDIKSHILKMCSQVNKFLLSQASLTFWDPDQILVPGTLL